MAEPLLAIAALAGGEWPQRAREALAECWGSVMAEDDSAGVKLLRAIQAAFKSLGMDRIVSSELAMAASPADGPGLTTPRLAWRLHPFGVTPRTIRLGGSTAKGYLLADFADPFARYLPGGALRCDAFAETAKVTPSQPAPALDEAAIPAPKSSQTTHPENDAQTRVNTALLRCDGLGRGRESDQNPAVTPEGPGGSDPALGVYPLGRTVTAVTTRAVIGGNGDLGTVTGPSQGATPPPR